MDPCLPQISKSLPNLATDSNCGSVSFRVPCGCCALAQQSCSFFKVTNSCPAPRPQAWVTLTHRRTSQTSLCVSSAPEGEQETLPASSGHLVVTSSL